MQNIILPTWQKFKIGDLFDEIQIGRKYVGNELSSRDQMSFQLG